MDNLIAALQIFRKYGNPKWPTCCEHDVLHVLIEASLVSQEDKDKLEELGFFVGEEYPDHFISFHFGA